MILDYLLNHREALWLFFAVVVGFCLAVDLGVLRKKNRELSMKEAAILSFLWIGLGVAFGGFVYLLMGPQKSAEYYAAFLIEKSLSVDNIFVFVMIFSSFKTPPQFQHKVLFLGILGAIFMRAIIIISGTALLNQFQWITYVFGALLLFTAWKMFQEGLSSLDPDDSEEKEGKLIGFVKSLFKRVKETSDGRFFLRSKGEFFVTPIFVTLVCIEISDLIFAVDSLPAVLAVSPDPFVILTSNIFAILGLRSLYFVSSSLVTKFSHLNIGVALILFFVGLKMLLASVIHIPVGISLAIIGFLLFGAIGYSLYRSRESKASQGI